MDTTSIPATGASGARPARAAAIRDGLGVGIGVGLSGVAFGAAAITAGLTVAQTCVLSLCAFTGASQFALAGVIAGGAAGADLIAGTAGALLLGARNTLYGLRLGELLRLTGWRRVVAAQGVIDETTAVTTARPAAARAGFLTTFACLYVMWNLTTLAGAVGTSQVADPSVLGLDVVGPATFLALLWPRLRASRQGRLRAVAACGALIALGTTPVVPSGVPVLLAALAVPVALLAERARP